jgi:hypothetical protein
MFRLQGDQLELQLSERRARLVAVADVSPLWNSAVAAARSMLAESLAVTVARLESATGRAACELIISEETEAVLRRIAAWRPGPASTAHDGAAS